MRSHIVGPTFRGSLLTEVHVLSLCPQLTGGSQPNPHYSRRMKPRPKHVRFKNRWLLPLGQKTAQSKWPQYRYCLYAWTPSLLQPLPLLDLSIRKTSMQGPRPIDMLTSRANHHSSLLSPSGMFVLLMVPSRSLLWNLY